MKHEETYNGNWLSIESERILKGDKAKQKKRELLESMNTRSFWHYCEVCGKKEYLTAQEAYDSGWDYPPNFGLFGMLSQRKCGDCGIDKTLWWKVTTTQKLPIVNMVLTVGCNLTPH